MTVWLSLYIFRCPKHEALDLPERVELSLNGPQLAIVYVALFKRQDPVFGLATLFYLVLLYFLNSFFEKQPELTQLPSSHRLQQKLNSTAAQLRAD